MKAVLLLKPPTQLTEVTSENEAAYAHPASGLQVALDIKGIMRTLQRAGPATRPSRTFDFCGKLVHLSEQKEVTKDDVVLHVSEAEFLDSGGGRVTVSVWNDAHRALARVQMGGGVAVMGCNATKDNGQVKLSIWPSAHMCAEGAQVETLTGLDESTVATETLTTTFTPPDLRCGAG